MSAGARSRAWCRQAAVLALAAGLAAAAGCVHEVVEPIRETTFVTTRSGDALTMTWTGRRGVYYNVLYTDKSSPGVQWTLHPQGMNLRAAADGEQMSVTDRVPIGQDRRYRLLEDTKPLVPNR